MIAELEKILKLSSGWLEKGKSSSPGSGDTGSGPRELHFELTYLCNQKCTMCDIWPRYRKNPALAKQELTFDEITSCVRSARLLKNLELILFSGGEPFLRPDFVQIAAFFAEEYPAAQLAILSNCFNTGLVIDQLNRICGHCSQERIMLGTSLDGIGEVHDKVRGAEGAFEKLNETLKMVRKQFPRLRIETNFTITPDNYSQIFSVFSFARKIGVGFSAQFPIPWEGTSDYRWRDGELATVEGDIKKIMEEIYREDGGDQYTVRSHTLSRLHYLQGLVEYERRPRRIFPHCPAPYDYAMISPHGDLYFCPKLKEMTAGNIRKTSFDRIWTGKAAEKIRRYIDSGACHCWLNCTAYMNIEKALRNGQPRTRGLVTAASGKLWNFYLRLKGRLLPLLQPIFRFVIYAVSFFYLLLWTGIKYLNRYLKSAVRGEEDDS